MQNLVRTAVQVPICFAHHCWWGVPVQSFRGFLHSAVNEKIKIDYTIKEESKKPWDGEWLTIIFLFMICWISGLFPRATWIIATPTWIDSFRDCIRFHRKQSNRPNIVYPSPRDFSSNKVRTWYWVRESDIWEVAVDAETDIEPKTPEAAAEAEDEGIPMDEDAPMDAFTGWRLVFRLPTSWKDMFADFVGFLVCLDCFLWAYDEAKKYFPSVIRKF